MRKITIAALALTFSSSLAFAQSSKYEVQAQRTVAGPEEVRVSHSTTRTNQAENTVWSEDFSNGIPSSWVNIGYDGFGNVLDSALWEYRGPNTNPNNTVGSRGAYMSAQTPIASPTASNGFVLFDSDYLDNAGTAGNFGNGKAPAPHIGTLTTPLIDLSTVSYAELKFNSYHRYFEGRAIIAFSTDGGTTWPDTLAAHPGIAVNASTATNAIVGLNVTSIVAGEDSVRLRFIFDGTYDDPGASGAGAGYYFWIIDDIEINELPKNEIRFTEWQGAPAQDIIFGPAAGSSKMGIMTLNNNTDQTRDIEFDANVYNYGWAPQSNVGLTVEVIDGNTNNVITSFSSTGAVSSLGSNDTADYNTLNTYGNPWTPTSTGWYRLVYKAVADSASAVSDTFNVYVTDSLMSNDFNTFDNRIGTANVGDDGSALATRIDLVQGATMTGVWIGLSNTSVAGGVIEVEVFDSTGFDYIAGYPTNALKATSPSAYTLTATDISNGFVQLPLTDGQFPYVTLPSGAYFVAVKMYSNSGASPVYLRNDQSVIQPAFSKLMYYTLDPNNPARWYTGFTSDVVNGLWIRAKLSMGVGLEEDVLLNSVKVGPNPATSFVNVAFENIEGEFTLTLTDISGRTISVENVNVFGAANHTLSVEGLAAGVYMLNINNGKASITQKISVQ